MLDPKKYQIKVPDWREGLRINRRKTFIVILLFIFIYMLLGFIIDLSLYAQTTTPGTDQTQTVSLQETATEIATLQLFPMATLVMLVIAGISLIIAYIFHQKMVMLGTDYHEISRDSSSLEERQLYNVIEELKIAAGLRYMPKIYIIEADYMNAFASGFTEKSALVAITRGLLEKLDRDELQAVMAHELSHIRNNDIRLTLTVLILSNIMLIAIDILFRGILYSRSRKNNGLLIIILVVRFVLPIITMLLMLYLSRTREFLADTGSVELTRNNEPLARALIKIHQNTVSHYDTYNAEYNNTPHEDVRQAAYFYDPKDANIQAFFSFNNLFSTHPSLEERLSALGIEMKKSDKE